MTKAKFKAKAAAAFIRANPDAHVAGWISCRRVKYPTGVVGFAGKFYAADKTGWNVMNADGDDTYVMVR